MEEKLEAAWEVNVRKTVPYVPGEQPKQENVIKLNTNENPYPPSPEVAEALRKLTAGELRKYPDPAASKLNQALADYHHVPVSRIFTGVGSDDVLAMAFMTFFHSGRKILFPDITYSFYPVWANLMEIPFETKPLDAKFQIRTEDYLQQNGRIGGIVFPNPNAPTGILKSREEILRILEGNPDIVVIVDEAYIDFAEEGSSVLDLTDQYENLLVTRTFSKSRSLAGLRIGYAVGSEKLMGYLNQIKYSYNSYTMNTPSIVLGTASVRDEAYFRETVEKIRSTRSWFTDEIRKIGFSVPESSANFVFAKPDWMTARELFQNAREAGIFFRYFDQPRIGDYLRITIGTREEMERVVDFIKNLKA